MNIHQLSAAQLAHAIRARELTAHQVVTATLERIDSVDRQINAFTHVCRDSALAQAARIDGLVQQGAPLPPLAGEPFAAKDLFDIEGVTIVAGSKVLRDNPPAARDAVLVARLKQAGTICIGALNMDEFAYGFTTENTHTGPTRNPHDHKRIAGGSSGGSGAAVAAGMVPIALGSDTNGSIRVPSALCGIFGLKPTFGRLSRTGSFPFVASLDHLGPFARSALDLALAYDACQGPDAQDHACAQRPVEATVGELSKGIAGLRERYEDYEPLSRDRFIAGALAPAAWYLKAQRFRTLFRQNVLRILEDVDILIAPATPCEAPAIGTEWIGINGKRFPARPSMGLLTQPISFIGLPVAVVPLQQDGMPIGVQLIAAPWREDIVLRAAAWLEENDVVAAPVAGN